MAYPVIIVDSASGSDSNSGAGPGDGTTTGSALTGTAGATDGAGTTVTLDAGTDLTNVATDGSHVIYLVDATAGHRRFSSISGKAGSGGASPTVTVNEAYTAGLSGKTWAIGGKRQTIGSASSALLCDNNNTDGDMMSGWIEQMDNSGYTETLAGQFPTRRPALITIGPITLRGKPGLATPPIITFSNNGNGFIPAAGTASGNFWQFENFDVQNSNATKTASTAFICSDAAGVTLRNIRINDSTNKFWRGINVGDQGHGWEISTCKIGYCADVGVLVGTSRSVDLIGTVIHDCTSHGFLANGSGTNAEAQLYNCIIVNNGGKGVYNNKTGASPGAGGLHVNGCTIDGNTSDGIGVSAGTSDTASLHNEFTNNIISNNGGYGINFSGSGVIAGTVDATCFIAGNVYYNNSSGKYNPSGITAIQESTANPTFTGGGDYTPTNTALDGSMYPAVYP